MKEYAEAFYKSKAWKDVRELVIKRDRYLCVDCLACGRYTPAEEVHHVVPLTPDNLDNPEITLALDNLVSLCRECHRARHGARSRRYSVDDYGRIFIK